MKTILITGGTSGIGKGIAINYLEKGHRVIVIGNSQKNRDIFYEDTKKIGAEERAFYIQSDLSSIKETQEIVKKINSSYESLDLIVFCAAKNSQTYTQTKEGFELTFALSYLSRFILSYGLKETLEKSPNPMIVNLCGTGMEGEVNWSDLGHKKNFDAEKVMLHSSRLNDLLGVEFAKNDTVEKIKYIMYNPMAVRTPGMMEAFNTPSKWSMFESISKPVEKAIIPLINLLNNPPASTLCAYREDTKLDLLDLNIQSYNPDNAKKLYNITNNMLEEFNNN